MHLDRYFEPYADFLDLAWVGASRCSSGPQTVHLCFQRYISISNGTSLFQAVHLCFKRYISVSSDTCPFQTVRICFKWYISVSDVTPLFQTVHFCLNRYIYASNGASMLQTVHLCFKPYGGLFQPVIRLMLPTTRRLPNLRPKRRYHLMSADAPELLLSLQRSIVGSERFVVVVFETEDGDISPVECVVQGGASLLRSGSTEPLHLVWVESLCRFRVVESCFARRCPVEGQA